MARGDHGFIFPVSAAFVSFLRCCDRAEKICFWTLAFPAGRICMRIRSMRCSIRLTMFCYCLGGTEFIRRSMCWCCFTALHRWLQRIFFWKKTASGRRFQNVALAVCYACCGYMAYNYQIIKWMIFPVIFPLFCPGAFAFAAGEKGRLVHCFARMAADVVHSARVYDASVFTFCRGDLALYL